MSRQDDEGLIELTVRLVLDDVCAKVNETVKEWDVEKKDSARKRHPRKLVDYETTEVEASEDETETNIDDRESLHSINDTAYISKHLAGSLADVSNTAGRLDDVTDETKSMDKVVDMRASGLPDLTSDSDESSESESYESSLCEEEKNESETESIDNSSDLSEASADEESEANDEIRIQQVRVITEKDTQNVDSEDNHSTDHDSDTGASHKHPPKVKGELQFTDLPVVCHVALVLSVDDELDKIGCVHSIVESLVIVQSRPMLPALDTDSVLWRSNRQPLGAIFETFGPVQSPYYSVRFRCPKQIHKSGISVGESIFFTPNNTQFTKYVFTHHLMQLKGSDASWTDDIEPPLEAVDFSDDEREQETRHPNPFPREDRGRKRVRKPRQNFQLNPRRQRGQTSNVRSHCHSQQITAPIDPCAQRVLTSSALPPLFPASGVQVSHPVVPHPVMPTVQAMPPPLPGFPKPELPAENGLSSVFYRPPPPGHVETYQQCYFGTSMQLSSPEYKQA